MGADVAPASAVCDGEHCGRGGGAAGGESRTGGLSPTVWGQPPGNALHVWQQRLGNHQPQQQDLSLARTNGHSVKKVNMTEEERREPVKEEEEEEAEGRRKPLEEISLDDCRKN